jgi:hypothetical protein
MEEVLNAPSLSISLKTATEASAILKDGYSFLKSEVKKPRPECDDSSKKLFSNPDDSVFGQVPTKPCDISVIEPQRKREIKLQLFIIID